MNHCYMTAAAASKQLDEINWEAAQAQKWSGPGIASSIKEGGIMGRGVALQFKNAFPQNFRAYEFACARGEVQPGKMFVFETGQLSRSTLSISRRSGIGAARAGWRTSRLA
jgi:hypothetical protein